jgi:hypothetical protein
MMMEVPPGRRIGHEPRPYRFEVAIPFGKLLVGEGLLHCRSQLLMLGVELYDHVRPQRPDCGEALRVSGCDLLRLL